METLRTPFGALELERVPVRPRQPLRAWDAADEYVLTHLTDDPLNAEATVLLVGDAFGSLACALRSFDPIVVNESAAGTTAIEKNLDRNGLERLEVYSILDLETLTSPLDCVVIKIPKSGAELVDVLHRIRPHVHAETRIIGAAMAKHIHTSTIETFESILGGTTTSLAKKKARLIFGTFDWSLQPGPNPWPSTWKAATSTLVNHGGGFSPTGLDVGTRFLLENTSSFAELIPTTPEMVRTVDLGCGNGVVGLRMAQDFLAADINFVIDAVDDSALAVAAAEASWQVTLPGVAEERAAFRHHHRLVEVVDKGSADLVVVNPPFHDDRVVGDETAWSMFTDAHKVLRLGGQLLVVGNRHLAYHAKLKKIFGQVDTVASNKRFVLLRAHR